MDKDDQRLYLSYAALGKLHELSQRLHQDPETILEGMINDRHSISDEKKNAARRREAWEKYRDSYLTENTECRELCHKAFVRGYNRGWRDFQTRHETFLPGLLIECKEDENEQNA